MSRTERRKLNAEAGAEERDSVLPIPKRGKRKASLNLNLAEADNEFDEAATEVADGAYSGEEDAASAASLCPHCGQVVGYGERGIECDGCGLWIHAQCEGLEDSEYDEYASQSDFKWLCGACRYRDATLSPACACNPLTSPPRAPLSVVNGPCNHLQLVHHRGSAASSPSAASGQMSAASSPSTSAASSPRTATEERLRKKLLRKNDKGETHLHRAAIKGSTRVAEKLLKIGIDPNGVDNAGYTALHEACNRGNLAVARLLVLHGANVNLYGGTDDQKETALHDAARNGHWQVVQFLVNKGANIYAKSCHGLTPLEEAKRSLTKNGTVADVIKFLSERQENVGQVSDVTSEFEVGEDEESVDIFKFFGIHNNKQTEEALRCLGILDQSSSTIKGSATSANTPLHGGKRSLKTERRSQPRQPRRSREDSRSSATKLNFEMADTTSSANAITAAATTQASTATSATGTTSTTSTTTPLAAASATPAALASRTSDIYDFKSGSKEATAVSGKTSTPPDASKSKEGTAMQGKEDLSKKMGGDKRPHEPDEPEADSKRKKDDLKGIRGTRGNSIDRSSAAGAGKSSGKGANSRSNSAANSPKKISAENSDSDDDHSKKSTDSSGLKVPPLKLVLSNSGGSGSVSPTEKHSKDGEGEDKAASDNGCDDDAGLDKQEGDGKAPSTAASRVTRSRANHGTSGPSDGQGDQASSTEQSGPSGTGQGGVAATGGDPATGSAATASSSSVHVLSNSSAASSAAGPSGTVSACESSRLDRTDTEYQVKKRKLRSQVEDSAGSSSSQGGGSGNNGGGGGGNGASAAAATTSAASTSASTSGATSRPVTGEPQNDIEKYLKLRRQIEQRWKNIFPVQPKPPQGFRDYLMVRKTYLLESNKHDRLRSIPRIQPPPSLDGGLRELFIEQENERYNLRKRHLVEKEKLVLSVEQEILRVHGRAARALANQSLPFSFCTYIRDEEIYTPIDPQQEEKNRDIRSRYNGRLFLSWLQDVDDKWEKIKEQMVLRHHNEAESLNAVQKMDWEWKVQELGKTPAKSTAKMQIDDLHIPMVHVSDDFDLNETR